MKKVLNRDSTLYFDKFFPYRTAKNVRKRHCTVLGIGGNIGNVRQRFNKLFLYLKKNPHLTIVQTSPILKNPPFGYLEQKDFYNAVILAETNLNPVQLLRFILKIEQKFKRERKFPNAPRTLDMDIIFFDKLKVRKDFLIIPHPCYQARESVTIPLAFIDYKHKGCK